MYFPKQLRLLPSSRASREQIGLRDKELIFLVVLSPATCSSQLPPSPLPSPRVAAAPVPSAAFPGIYIGSIPV